MLACKISTLAPNNYAHFMFAGVKMLEFWYFI